MTPLDPRTSFPEPDMQAPDRIWARFQATRQRKTRWRAALWGAGALGAAAAAVLLATTLLSAEPERTVALNTGESATQAWSDVISLDVAGVGQAWGTDRDLSVVWQSGTLRTHVTPNTDTRVRIETDEAVVHVVGTVFDVTRDLLGTTVTVQRGTVQVDCEDGWTGALNTSQAHTCLPVTPTGLLGRADALLDSDAPSSAVMATLDAGISAADDGPVLGELLVRRIQLLSDAGAVHAVVRDAERYVAMDGALRRHDVQQMTAWLVLREQGCDAAERWLVDLHSAGAGPHSVLLAECVADDDPERALSVLHASEGSLDDVWQARADGVRSALRQ